jgi:molybdopterin synthase catalytic subunit
MFVQHRIGTVEISEPSVVIASRLHRDAAFAAASIRRLKRSMPIWKESTRTARPDRGAI